MKSVGLLLVCLMAVGAGVNGASVEMFQNGIGSYNGVDDTTLMSDAAEYDCGDFNLYAGDDVGDDRKILIRFGGLD